MCNHKEALFGGAASGGKLLSRLTNILTTTGWTTIGDLRVGEFIFDENGEPTEVLAKSEVVTDEKCYRVKMTTGEEIIAGENHLWNIANERQRASYAKTDPHKQAERRAKRASRGKPEGEKLQTKDGRARGTAGAAIETNSRRAQKARETKLRPSIWTYTTKMTTKEAITLQESERHRVTIPNAKALNTTGAWESEVPPYTFGAWLGDGGAAQGTLYVCEGDRVALTHELQADGWSVEIYNTSSPSDAPDNYRTQDFHELKLTRADGTSLKDILKREGFLDNKHIPDWIILAPHADRQAFLGGFCDTDGHVNKDRNRVEFILAREDMVRGAHAIFWSIGESPTSIRHKRTTNQDPDFEGSAWRFDVNQCSSYLFRFPRKRDILLSHQNAKTKNHTTYRSIQSITPTLTVPTQCIQVANPTGLFRVGRTFLTTHNSDALLMSFLQFADTPGYAGIIFRNTLTDLKMPSALMDRSHSWFGENPDIRWAAQDNTWHFPSGASLSFGYLENPDDHNRYRGAEFQFVGMDEVTEIREHHYEFLFSRLRRPMTGPLSRVPTRMRAATNPAPNWVRRRFIEEKKDGRIFIQSLLTDNPHIDQEGYRENLSELDPVTRAQMEHGDWYADSSEGVFKRSAFPIYESWEVPLGAFHNQVRCWDLASTEATETNKDPDYTAGALCSIYEGVMYVHDIARCRRGPEGTEKFLRDTAIRDGQSVRIRVDQDPGQAGASQISNLSRRTFLGFDFDGHKVSKGKRRVKGALKEDDAKMRRAKLWAGGASRGEVVLIRGDWNNDFLDEASGFGSVTGAHDDMIDSLSSGYEVITCITG